MSLIMFFFNRSLEDSDRSVIDIKFFFRKVIQYQMQFVINSKVQVIVLGFTAVIRLVISSILAEICGQNGKLRHFYKLSFKVLCHWNGNLDISRMFQICSLKETTNPEYIEKFISELYPEWTSLLGSLWTLLL